MNPGRPAKGRQMLLRVAPAVESSDSPPNVFFRAHAKGIPKEPLNSYQLRRSFQAAVLTDLNKASGARKIEYICDSWKRLMAGIGEEEKGSMEPALEDFLSAVFNKFGFGRQGNAETQVHDEKNAMRVVDSVCSLMPYAPETILPFLSRLFLTAESSEMRSFALLNLYSSYDCLYDFQPGDRALYEAFEIAASSLEAEVLLGRHDGRPTPLDLSEDARNFLATAASLAMEDAGLHTPPVVPKEHSSLVAYALMFGIDCSPEIRMKLLRRIPELFGEASQKAIFSRLASWGMLMPELGESQRHCRCPTDSGSLLQIVLQDAEKGYPMGVFRGGESESEKQPLFFVTPEYSTNGLPDELQIPVFGFGPGPLEEPPEPRAISSMRSRMVSFARIQLESLGVVTISPQLSELPPQ
jgi:hypothetical protein